MDTPNTIGSSSWFQMDFEGHSDALMIINEEKDVPIVSLVEEQELEYQTEETPGRISGKTVSQLMDFFSSTAPDNSKFRKKSPPRVLKSVASKIYKFEKLTRQHEPEPEEGYDEVDTENDQAPSFGRRSKFTGSLRNPKSPAHSNFVRRWSGRFDLYHAVNVNVDDVQYECTKL